MITEIDIYGAIVQGNGTVSNPSGIPITTASGPQFTPAAAFNGLRYFVAWCDASGENVNLTGTRVTTAGDVSAAVAIDATGPVHLHPSLAAAGSTFLVVWEDYRNAGVTFIDVLGKRVNDAGAVIDGAAIPIGTAFRDALGSALKIQVYILGRSGNYRPVAGPLRSEGGTLGHALLRSFMVGADGKSGWEE